eukprot:scaffold61441_cov67-Phaeocystis_antarctica.AAC.2
MARRTTRPSRRTNRRSRAKSTARAIGGGWLRVATPAGMSARPARASLASCLRFPRRTPPPAPFCPVTVSPAATRAVTASLVAAVTPAAMATAITTATPTATPAVPPAPLASTAPQARHSWPHAPWPSRQASPRPSAVPPHPHHRLSRHHAPSHTNQRSMRARAGTGTHVCNSNGYITSATCAELYFNVVGPCTVYGNFRNCVRSPNYPSNYGDSQRCTITPTSRAVGQLLSATAFNTESRYDKLIVNGVTYDGTIGPSNVLLGSAFTWSSDGSVVRTGWQVCAAPPPPPSPSQPPSPSPSPPPP